MRYHSRSFVKAAYGIIRERVVHNRLHNEKHNFARVEKVYLRLTLY